VHDDGGAVLERSADHGSRRVVHDQRHAEPAPDRRHLADREHGELRVGQRLRVVGARARVGRPAEGLRIGRIDEAHGAPGEPLLLREIPVVRGNDLADAQAAFDRRTNEPVIAFRFNNAGARAFVSMKIRRDQAFNRRVVLSR
jgi:preprotein translocase subunit SecD